MLAGGVQCLVTGGAGFIGSHVATRLAALGCRVRVVDDLSTGDESNLTELAGRIEFLRGDLCDPEVCRQVGIPGHRWTGERPSGPADSCPAGRRRSEVCEASHGMTSGAGLD